MSLIENIKFSVLTSGCIAWQGLCYLLGRERFNCIKNIANYLSDQNIIYSKIFQSLSCGANILSKEEMLFLSRFNDEAPYNKEDIWDIDTIIRNVNITTGKSLEVDNIPLKSGMIALAYKGKLEGEDIIIKVKRKNILAKLNDGLDKMEYIMNLTQYLPYLNLLSLPEIFEENRDDMLKQTDFKNELNMSEQVYNNFKLIDDIVIPKVYREFTEVDNRIIVMKFIQGKTLHNVEKEKRYEYGELIAKYSMKSLLYDRLYHNDLHAGNVIFIEDLENNIKKIGVIDFGTTGTLSRDQQDIFYTFFKEGAINKDYDAARNVLVNDLTCPKEVYNNLEEERKTELLNELTSLTRDCFDSVAAIDAELLYNLNLCLRKYNLKLSRYFCKLQLSLGICGSVCNELCDGEEGRNYMSCIEKAIKIMVEEQESMFEY